MNTDDLWPDLDEAESQVLRMQAKLHQWATDRPDRRFCDLYNLVSDPAFLVVAWHRVRGNRGARSAGVPNSILFGDRLLAELRDDLKDVGSSLFLCGNGFSPSPAESCAALASPRSRHGARLSKSSPVSDSVVVTHPFHPLAGETLVVIFEKARPGADWVVVSEGGLAGRVTLPVGWTDRAPASLSYRLAMEGLAELAVLAAALGHPPLARRRRS